MREIARRAGRGNVSSSTVHNVFSGSRVPKWEFLEIIVNALGGGASLGEFHAFWDLAWVAQNDAGLPRDGFTYAARQSSREGIVRPTRQASPSRAARGLQRPSQRIWSSEIPPRNPNFTGRETLLERLGHNLDGRRPPHVQVVSGMGGVGKTELATEYIHRNIGKYDIVWWIRAEHHDRVREALVALSRRLEPRLSGMDSSRDRTIAAVLERLQSDAEPSWLLVYDNVANPFDLEKYLPACRPEGHIIVTLRQRNWPNSPKADLLELSPFSEAEAISFLRRRVSSLAVRDMQELPAQEEDARRVAEAARLAAELGYLPIAIDHAAAYLTETTWSVDEYLTRFTQDAHNLLQVQHGDSDPHAHVSGTWTLSNEVLTADARHLFNLCAFFSPEPIAVKLFLQGSPAIDDPPGLADFLSSPPRLRAAMNQLHRLSLARVDAARDMIQMHRVVQAVTQGRLREAHIDQFHTYSAAVDGLLAKSNPGNPDQSSRDTVYDLSLQHLESDYRFLRTSNSALRDLIIDQVRRLHLRGDHVEALQFGLDALGIWRERHGEDDLGVLTMAVEVAIAMFRGGRIADAHEMIQRIQPFLRPYEEGEGFKVSLLCESIHGAVLRARSQFHEALALDQRILPQFKITFGEANERTLNVWNNIAFDYRQLGQFRRALKTDRQTFEDRSKILGRTDPLTLHSHNAVARDLRCLGHYQASLDIAREVCTEFEALGAPENLNWLRACEGFATALRKAGYHWDALQQRELVLERYRDYLGDEHMLTLTAATNLINDRRAVGDLIGAGELADETYRRCRESSSPGDLLPYAAQLNLASVLRVAGNAQDAIAHDEQARKGLLRIYGDEHPFTLAADINYATDLAGTGRLGEAIQIGHKTLDKCLRHESLGETHPDTLMVAANLSIDEAVAGDMASAEQRLSHVLGTYAETLSVEHPETRAVAQGVRLTAEIEPEV